MSHTLPTGLPGAAFPDRASERLYRNALAQTWRIEDVPWERLDLTCVARPVRQAMGVVYGDILFGELSGFALARRLSERLEASWAHDLADCQAADEARHIEFFARVLEQLDAGVDPTAPLRALSQDVLACRDLDALMLGALIVETTAQVIFIEGAKHNLRLAQHSLRLPGTGAVQGLLEIVLHYVGRDEARHVAFGAKFLESRRGDLDARRRSALQQQAEPWCRWLISHYELRSAAYARLGFQPQQLLDRLWQAQRRQLGRLGIEIGERPTHNTREPGAHR